MLWAGAGAIVLMVLVAYAPALRAGFVFDDSQYLHENLALRDRMWLSATIGLRLDTTTTQLRAVLDALRTLLDAVPRVDRGSASVRLVGLTPIALEVLVSAYILTRSADEFVALREEFFLQALDAIDAHGSGLSGRPFVVVRPTDAT